MRRFEVAGSRQSKEEINGCSDEKEGEEEEKKMGWIGGRWLAEPPFLKGAAESDVLYVQDIIE